MEIRKIAILPYPGPLPERAQKTKALTEETQFWLENKGITVVTDPNKIKKDAKPDLICILGGDGMFMHTIERFLELDAPFLGVNFGTKGFLLPIEPSQFQDFLQQILTGKKPDFEERTTIAASATINSRKYGPFICINDVVVKSDFYMVTLEVLVDNQIKIRPRGDGVIVCTPTGSTAYNFGAGGTPLAANSPNFGITAIACGDRRESNSFANQDQIIIIKAISGKAAFVPNGSVLKDENGIIWLSENDFVTIEQYKKKYRTLVPHGHDPYEYMKRKLYD